MAPRPTKPIVGLDMMTGIIENDERRMDGGDSGV